MEFNFEKGECDNDFFKKIQIKNNFVVFFGENKTFALNRKEIKAINLYYFKKDKEFAPFTNRSLKDDCDLVQVELIHDKPTTVVYFYHKRNYDRLNTFIDFILSITDDIPNKMDDIFDFLIGQKRFEENKDSL